MATVTEIDEVFRLLNKNVFLKHEAGDYCELDENNVVLFKRKSGQVFMMMNKADYEVFMSGANPYKDDDDFSGRENHENEGRDLELTE